MVFRNGTPHVNPRNGLTETAHRALPASARGGIIPSSLTGPDNSMHHWLGIASRSDILIRNARAATQTLCR